MSLLEYPFDGATILQKKRSLKRELLQKENLIPKKIAILSGSTVGEIKNILELFLLDSGIAPTFYEGEYSLFYENLVFDDGSLAAFAPDIIYIHTSAKNIKHMPSQNSSAEDINAGLTADYTRFENAWHGAEKYNCPIIQNNFELPSYRLMGNKDACDVHGRVNYTNRLNTLFAEYAAKAQNFYINDINYLSATVGIDNWCSESVWYAYKYAMDTQYIPLLCHSIANIIKSLLGKNKKSVILDLDNTLWGGIIGDDGAEGIMLGNETPEGMAYTEFQQYLKELSHMGVMLNVCSKNEESIAKTGFLRADSVLKYEDFLCFKANWEPKHLNVNAISKELNILPDSFVFMDDNPAEREIVQTEIKGISVPELTAPEQYIKAIDRAGYFEVTILSQDDKKRNDMYKQNLQRQAMEESFGDYTDYLKSLDMHCYIGSFDLQHTERITQLINKTNQFNLTTRRYTQSEVEGLVANGEYITLYGSLTDKFGDNGIVTAIIGHISGETLNIDLWIMSCRTFKRQLEYAMFDALCDKCLEIGIKTINGIYLPTAKNLLVSEFYATIGFNKLGDGKFAYSLNADRKPLCEVMDINII
ncbi:MAG: HAD-IIIC family phosphatase [Oscillospiraceae bacterium]